MQVDIVRDVSKGVEFVKISFSYGHADQEQVKRYGYPSVEVGGVIPGDVDHVDFVLPNATKTFNQFPHLEKFDGMDIGHELAQIRCDLYIKEMKKRIDSVWAVHRAINPIFSSRQTYTI